MFVYFKCYKILYNKISERLKVILAKENASYRMSMDFNLEIQSHNKTVSRALGVYNVIKTKINLDIVLSCLNFQNNNRYNIYIQFSIQYQDCVVKNLVLS